MNNTVRHLPNGDFEIVYDKDNPRNSVIEIQCDAMKAELERRCALNKQGHLGDVVAGR